MVPHSTNPAPMPPFSFFSAGDKIPQLYPAQWSTTKITPPSRQARNAGTHSGGDRALSALGRDEAQQVDPRDDSGDDGDGAVGAAGVGPLFRAHEREVVAVEPARQLLQRGVQPDLFGGEIYVRLVFLEFFFPPKDSTNLKEYPPETHLNRCIRRVGSFYACRSSCVPSSTAGTASRYVL